MAWSPSEGVGNRHAMKPDKAARFSGEGTRPETAIHRVYVASAPLDYEEAVMLLLALLPSPPSLRAIMEHPARTQAPAEGSETVRFVRCVGRGREISIFWVPDLTAQQAAAIAATCEPIRKWSVEAFISAVSRALGTEVKRLQ
jgi:hypothetical protein